MPNSKALQYCKDIHIKDPQFVKSQLQKCRSSPAHQLKSQQNKLASFQAEQFGSIRPQPTKELVYVFVFVNHCYWSCYCYRSSHYEAYAIRLFLISN